MEKIVKNRTDISLNKDNIDNNSTSPAYLIRYKLLPT